MRVVKLYEKETECPNCGSTLAYTSNDIQLACDGKLKYVKCPVCESPILIEIN